MSSVAKKLLSCVAAGAVLMATTSAWAIADAGAEMRGDFSGRGLTGSTVYSPMIVRAPALQTPAAERQALSVEPAAPATAKAPAAKAPVIAKKDATTTRSYSVEPAPAMRSYAPARSLTPLYLLPKGDSRRYGS